MPSRKEEKEALRQRRVEAELRERQLERRRLRIGYGLMALLAAPVVIGIVVLIASAGGGSMSGANIDTTSGATNGAEPDGRAGTAPPQPQGGNLKRVAAQAGCDLRLGLTDEGSSHLPEGASAPRYGTNPPTSGNHSAVPQADGAYRDTPPVINAVHSLEHGRVAIHYSPDLEESEQLELKGLFDNSPGGVLFFPNENMPYEVAGAAWTNFMGCGTYEGAKTQDALLDFRERFRGKGPEATPINQNA